MKDFLRRHTPKKILDVLIVLSRSTADAGDAVRGRLIPPRHMRGPVGGQDDFLQVGNEFLGYFKNQGGIRPDHHVLEVGCGVGRMAIPLTTYISKTGTYDGFDIVPEGIKWCSERITTRHPNFRFKHADIRNKMYNPNGRLTPATFQFPYSDETFDFIFLTSVFTHMLERDMNHYFSEICRVLKQDGRCFITWFLLNNESKHLIESGHSTLQFSYPIERGLTTDPRVPESAIAYEESDVLEIYKRNGISLIRPIFYGSWCGRKEYLSYQDICVGHKGGLH